MRSFAMYFIKELLYFFNLGAAFLFQVAGGGTKFVSIFCVQYAKMRGAHLMSPASILYCNIRSTDSSMRFSEILPFLTASTTAGYCVW